MTHCVDNPWSAWDGRAPERGNLMQLRARWTIVLTVLLSTAVYAQTPQRTAAFPTDPFAVKVLESLEFVDYPDVLLAVAVNNSTPWTRYDQGEFAAGRRRPLLERWIQATTEPAVSQDFEAELLRVHQIFQEIPDDG